MSPGVYYDSPLAVPGVYLSPCVYLSPALIRSYTVFEIHPGYKYLYFVFHTFRVLVFKYFSKNWTPSLLSSHYLENNLFHQMSTMAIHCFIKQGISSPYLVLWPKLNTSCTKKSSGIQYRSHDLVMDACIIKKPSSFGKDDVCCSSLCIKSTLYCCIKLFTCY